MRSWVKKILIVIVALFIVASFAVWYIFNEKFTDTQKVDAEFKVEAQNFIKEFTQNDTTANKKYVEKIISVKGAVSEIEMVDSIVNVKMIDTTTDAYIIFAFQDEEMKKAKLLKEGEKVTIKGSCSGGAYSEILEAEFINFKRCVITK